MKISSSYIRANKDLCMEVVPIKLSKIWGQKPAVLV